MGKCLLLCVLVVAVFATNASAGPLDQYQTIMGVRVYELDPNCAMLGGLCVKSNDCLERTTKNGLCPSNQNIGVECCYELAAKEGSCRSYGGECMPGCSQTLRRPNSDCGRGEYCCVLI